MQKSAEEEFVAFVQKYPECYAIAKSDLFMRILRIVCVPKTTTELVVAASTIKEKDMLLMLLALESAGLCRRATNYQKEVCLATEKGKHLIELFDAARNSL
ncbi:MAG: hypothetical protein NUV67_05865 [archaeon]|nr:hypothetical protein [archaeon]